MGQPILSLPAWLQLDGCSSVKLVAWSEPRKLHWWLKDWWYDMQGLFLRLMQRVEGGVAEMPDVPGSEPTLLCSSSSSLRLAISVALLLFQKQLAVSRRCNRPANGKL